MADEPLNDLTPLGYYNFRNQRKKFGIKTNDRRRHIYVVGKTGTGKTTLLKNMMIADIRAGRGVAVIDPHGDFAESLLDYVPEERIQDVIYFDPSDKEFPIAFNPMEQVGTEFRHLVASGIMSVFKKIWVDAWSARMEYILNNTLLSLLEFPGTNLLGVMRMFSDKEYRKQIVQNLKDPVIKAFWEDEFANYGQRLESEALAAIQNKVGQLVSNPLIRNILGQSHSTLNMRQIMDEGKIFIVNLSKGKIGEDNSALLGAMIITRFQLAAMSRVDIPEDKRRDFFLYVDEFQNFATDSFANILSEARKYGLSLVLAHQYIGQLEEGDNTRVRDAIFGNVGTIITFRVGAKDGEFLEMEFMPQFLQTDLVNLAFANIYVRLMIDGVASQPFSAETLPPAPAPAISYRDVILKNSEQRYGTPRAVVEKKIATEWESSGSSAVGEKVVRRDERSLRDMLRPDAPVQNRPPRFGVPSRPFSDAASARNGSSSTNHAPVRQVSAPMPSNARNQAPVDDRTDRRDGPPAAITGGESSRIVHEAAPGKAENGSVRAENVATTRFDAASKPADGQGRIPVSASSRASDERDSSGKRPVPSFESQNNENDSMMREFLKSREEISAKQEEKKEKKQFPHPPVDVDALRRSIAQSMGKAGGPVRPNESKVSEKSDFNGFSAGKRTDVSDHGMRSFTKTPVPTEHQADRQIETSKIDGKNMRDARNADESIRSGAGETNQGKTAQDRKQDSEKNVPIKSNAPISDRHAPVGMAADSDANGKSDRGERGGGWSSLIKTSDGGEKTAHNQETSAQQPKVLTLRELKEKSQERESKNENHEDRNKTVKGGGAVIIKEEGFGQKAKPPGSRVPMLEEEARSRPKKKN